MRALRAPATRYGRDKYFACAAAIISRTAAKPRVATASEPSVRDLTRETRVMTADKPEFGYLIDSYMDWMAGRHAPVLEALQSTSSPRPAPSSETRQK
jgi:hypothetical protein